MLRRKTTKNSKKRRRNKSVLPKSSSKSKAKYLSSVQVLIFKLMDLGTTFVVDEQFEYIKQIGHGAYGVVCSAYDHKNKIKVAIKKVPKAFEDLIDAKRIVREIKLLSTFFFKFPRVLRS